MNAKLKAIAERSKGALMWTAGGALLALLVAVVAGAFVAKIPSDAPLAKRSLASPLADAGATFAAVVAVEEPAVERYPGAVRPAREAIASPRIVAAVRDVLVAAGATVKAGDPLVRLDDRDLQARASQAESGLAEAEARRVDAANAFERAKSLREQNIASQSALDNAEAAAKAAEAAVAAAEERLREARVALTYAVLEAPFDAVVVDRYVDPGDTASPGTPLLKLYDPSRLRLEAFAPEGRASTLRAGGEARVAIDALGGEPMTATIEEIVPQSEAGSRSLLVKASLPADLEGLYPGMFGRLLLDGAPNRRLLVTEAAIVSIGQLRFVEMEGGGRRLVVPGRRAPNGMIEVLSGLDEGERIAVPRGE